MVSFAFRSSNSSTGQEMTTHTQEVDPTKGREQNKDGHKKKRKRKQTNNTKDQKSYQTKQKKGACKSWA